VYHFFGGLGRWYKFLPKTKFRQGLLLGFLGKFCCSIFVDKACKNLASRLGAKWDGVVWVIGDRAGCKWVRLRLACWRSVASIFGHSSFQRSEQMLLRMASMGLTCCSARRRAVSTTVRGGNACLSLSVALPQRSYCRSPRCRCRGTSPGLEKADIAFVLAFFQVSQISRNGLRLWILLLELLKFEQGFIWTFMF